MIRTPLWSLLLLICLISSVFAQKSELIVRYPAPETSSDHRYDYYWQLLDRALSVTSTEYGPYHLIRDSSPMSDSGSIAALEHASGRIDVLVRGGIADFERRLLPIRFPLDKGLLGYRVFLIRASTQSALDKVNTLSDLQKFSIGQGAKWGDIDILRQGGFKVIEGPTYDGLFRQLSLGRFDLFSRGVMEIGNEYAQYKNSYPNLAIEKNLLFYYPLCRYFYVSRTPSGRALAKRISDGMEALLKSGEFDQMFAAFKQPFETQINFKSRKIFRISNSQLTSETPLNRPQLWYDPTGPQSK